MPKGVQIAFTLNPKEFLRGLKRIELDLDDVKDSLTDTADAADDAFDDLDAKDAERGLDDVKKAADKAARGLDEVGDEGKQAGRDVERGLKDGARDAEAGFRDLGRSATRAFDKVKQESREAGRATGDNLRGGINETALGVVGAEVAQEFVQSWGEAIRAGNPAEAIYEVLTNAGAIAAAAVPGIGTIVGLGIATVSGIVQGIRQENQRVQEAILGTIGSVSDDVIEEQGYTTGSQYIIGLNRALSEETQRRENLKEIYGTDDWLEALGQAVDKADEIGVSLKTVTDIQTGTTKETDKAIEGLEEYRDILQDEINAAYEEAGGNIENLTIQEQKHVSELVNQRDLSNDLIAQGETRLAEAEERADLADRANEAFQDEERTKGRTLSIDEKITAEEEAAAAATEARAAADALSATEKELQAAEQAVLAAKTREERDRAREARDAILTKRDAQLVAASAAEREANAMQRTANFAANVASNYAYILASGASVRADVALSVARQDAALANRNPNLDG